jgi:PKD repeat protein
VHTYTSEGDYDCQLIAYNHYGSDTFFFTVSVQKTDISVLQTEKFDLYPNPNNGAFQLSYPKTIEITSLKLLNIQGQAIQTLDPLQSEFTLNTGFVPGIYILEITTNSGIVYLRMVVS